MEKGNIDIIFLLIAFLLDRLCVRRQILTAVRHFCSLLGRETRGHPVVRRRLLKLALPLSQTLIYVGVVHHLSHHVDVLLMHWLIEMEWNHLSLLLLGGWRTEILKQRGLSNYLNFPCQYRSRSRSETLVQQVLVYELAYTCGQVLTQLHCKFRKESRLEKD